MSINSETAQEYLRLADRCLSRGEVAEAIRYADKAMDRLLREQIPVVDEAAIAGTIRGESVRYGHLGKVLAEKARLAEAVK